MSESLTRRGLLRAICAAPLLPDAIARDIGAFETPYKYDKLVLAGSGKEGEFDSKFVDCPFVFSHDKRFYMTYIGYDGIGYQTGLASSQDLVTWTKHGCIVPRDPNSPITRYNAALHWIVRENAMRSPGKLKRIQGRFLGVYNAYPNSGYEEGAAVIGLCWSNDLRHWKLDEPILRAEEGADWERGGLYKPCLIEHDGIFYLSYNAKTKAAPPERGWREQIGAATSHDLKKWTRYSSNPIVRNGAAESWDERFASDPCVVLDGDRWIMFYYGLDRKGKARDLLAIGNDPFHFQKADKILIDVGQPGSVDSTYAHKPSVIYHDGALYHYYCAVSGKYPNEIRGISVARSKPWT
jgi:predicted GH43/DUF377 family glycosyl hydrolase